MLLQPTLGYRLFITGFLFVLGAVFVLVMSIKLLVTGTVSPYISTSETISTFVMGLVMMGIGGFVHREVRKGRLK